MKHCLAELFQQLKHKEAREKDLSENQQLQCNLEKLSLPFSP